MRQISGRELVAILERNGWKVMRIHGTHHVLGKPGERARISVPVHGSTPLKAGLLRHLLKTAGIDHEELG